MKSYDLKFETGKEFVKRLEIFIKQVEEVTEWNKDPTHTWKKGLNQFSHMTGEEWRAYLGLTAIPSRNLRKNRQIPGRPEPLVHGEPTEALGDFSTGLVCLSRVVSTMRVLCPISTCLTSFRPFPTFFLSAELGDARGRHIREKPGTVRRLLGLLRNCRCGRCCRDQF